jgi:hypothetical protein
MSLLCASARDLSEVIHDQRNDDAEIVSEALQFVQRIQLFLNSMEDWTSKVGEQWRPETVNPERLQQPKEVLNSSSVSTPTQVLK